MKQLCGEKNISEGKQMDQPFCLQLSYSTDIDLKITLNEKESKENYE